MGVWDRVKRWVVGEPTPEERFVEIVRAASQAREAAPVTAPPPPPPPPVPEPEPVLELHRNLALEEAIAQDPDDEEAYLVYADWLAERGDPRGELIAVQHAQRAAATVADLRA